MTPTTNERGAVSDDARLVAALRTGDEHAFTTLLDRHHPAMVRVARATVGSDAADQVVAEAWRSALRRVTELDAGISVKTWLVRSVLVHANRSAFGGHREPARAWGLPQDDETLAAVREAVAKLPPRQQIVIGLRDIEGWSAQEVCDTLGISPECQRALLNRARRRVHRALLTRLEAA